MSCTPSIPEGTYWIRNQQLRTVIGLGTSNLEKIAEKQEPHSPRQRLSDRSQMWLFEILSDGVHFQIRNASSGGVMGLKAPDVDSGSSIVLAEAIEDDRGQQWRIEWIDDYERNATYRIVNAHNGTVLDQGILAPGQPIKSYPYHGRPNQRWFLEPAFLPTVVWLEHVRTGWYLQYDASNANHGAVARDKIPSTSASRCQLWFLEPQGVGKTYVIHNLEDDTKVLDLSDGTFIDGTPVLVCDYKGGRSQNWNMQRVESTDDPSTLYDTENTVYNLVNARTDTMAQVGEGGSLQVFGAQDPATSQRWRIIPCPFPPLFWGTMQSTHTGMFITQDGGRFVAARGSRYTLDQSVQWRFVPHPTTPHHFSIVNRATGLVVMGGNPAVTVTERGRGMDSHFWAMGRERGARGFGIVNTVTGGALDQWDGGATIQAPPNNGMKHPHRQWVIVQVFSNRLPSFAIVNARTGRSLTHVSTTQSGGNVVSAVNKINSFSSQWLLKNLNTGVREPPVFAIINKMCGNVLDHYCGRYIAADGDSTDYAGHRWRLVPCVCGEMYFQIVNEYSGRYLEEEITGVPDANATGPVSDPVLDEHRAQCWELVSARSDGIDRITVDDDVLQATLEYMEDKDLLETYRCLIEKRAPGREKKGQNKHTHIPQSPRCLTDFAPIIRTIFDRVINQWEEDTIHVTTCARARVATNRGEVEQEFGIPIPPALRRHSEVSGWIRIDVQRPYETAPGQRVVNIVGQWLEDPVFHVVVPVGVRVGRENIRAAMRQSLGGHTSVIVTHANSVPPAGGTMPGTTPPPAPRTCNGWIYYAEATSSIVLLSPLGM